MTSLKWNSGTAYDFFISLLVLHHAADFGLRPYWAAGVRQRLSDPHREVLERFFSYAPVPLDWINSLPEPQDALPVLECAARLAPAESFRLLALPLDASPEIAATLERTARRSSTTRAEKEFLLQELGRRNSYLKAAGVEHLLRDWRGLESSSRLLRTALQEYYTVFFCEEEQRIRPWLLAGLKHAQGRASRLSLNRLVEELSHGVRFEGVDSAQRLVLVPSYWSTPFVFRTYPAEGTTLIVFGCRPELQSVAPGADIPDALVSSLKSLADPTRLRILRHLTERPMTPTELSRLLRLRPPTVLHHLTALRFAGLVAIRVSGTGEKQYAAREQALKLIFSSLKSFIENQD